MSRRIAKYIDYFANVDKDDVSTFRSYLDKIDEEMGKVDPKHEPINRRAALILNATEEPFKKNRIAVGGYSSPEHGTYSINPNAEYPNRTTTHELAHIAYKHEQGGPKFWKELEAESTAYAVAHLLGVDPDANAMKTGLYLFPYAEKAGFSAEQVGNILEGNNKIKDMARGFVKNPDYLKQYAFKDKATLEKEAQAARIEANMAKLMSYPESSQDEIIQFAKRWSRGDDYLPSLGLGLVKWEAARKVMDEFSRLNPLQQSHVTNFMRQHSLGEVQDIDLFNVEMAQKAWRKRKDSWTTYNPDFERLKKEYEQRMASQANVSNPQQH